MQVCIPLISYKRYDLVINEDIFKVLIIWAKTSWIEMQNTLYSLLKLIFILVTQFKFHVVSFATQTNYTALKIHKIWAEIFGCSHHLERLYYRDVGVSTLLTQIIESIEYTQYSSWEVSHLVSPFFLFAFSCCSQAKRVSSLKVMVCICIVLFMHVTTKGRWFKKTEDLQPLVPFTFDVFRKWLKYQYVYWAQS